MLEETKYSSVARNKLARSLDRELIPTHCDFNQPASGKIHRRQRRTEEAKLQIEQHTEHSPLSHSHQYIAEKKNRHIELHRGPAAERIDRHFLVSLQPNQPTLQKFMKNEGELKTKLLENFETLIGTHGSHQSMRHKG